MATDHFNRAVNIGDTIWVVAEVVGETYPNNIQVKVPGINSSLTITVQGGSTGETTNPSLTDRPPK